LVAVYICSLGKKTAATEEDSEGAQNENGAISLLSAAFRIAQPSALSSDATTRLILFRSVSMGFTKSKKSKEDVAAKEEASKKVPLVQLFRYATWRELVLLFVGISVSLVTGAGLPLMSILQGRVTQAFVQEEMYKTNTTPGPSFTYNDTNFTHDLMGAIYGYTGMAIGMFVAANVQVTCFLIVCEQMSNRIRRKFVQSILRQDISWFDKNNSGTLATKLFEVHNRFHAQLEINASDAGCDTTPGTMRLRNRKG
uniref:ABC transmembrane type-1 domain-containing protein n=1 Tax=Heligmosomoides polygyrus TaxID=6339 RepID=A0A8L8L291_HELPZ